MPHSSAKVVSYLDAGLRPVWSLIAERMLAYARKTQEKDPSNWTRIALEENISLGDSSPYIRNLLHWKERTNIYGLNRDMITKYVRKAAMEDVLIMANRFQTTTFAMSIPGSSSMTPWFKPKKWVSDCGISKIFAQFRCSNAGFGNRASASDGKRYKLCPLCLKDGSQALNNEVNNKTMTGLDNTIH